MCDFILFQMKMDFYFLSKGELGRKRVQSTENEEQSKENNTVGLGVTVVSEGIDLTLRFSSREGD